MGAVCAVATGFHLTECRNYGYSVTVMEKVTIGRRGVLTLPARLRKRYGLRQNDELVVEETPQGLLLRPAVSMPIELYTEERIAEFMEEDEALGKVLDERGG